MPPVNGDFPHRAPDSNSVTQSQIDALTARVKQLRDAIASHEQHADRQKLAARRLALVSFQIRVRRTADSFLGWRWAGVLVTALAAGFVIFVATLSWKIALAAVLIGAPAAVFTFYVPGDSSAAMESEHLRSELAAFQTANRTADRQRAELSEASETLRRHFESVQYRRQQLARANWKAMRGGELEQFLEKAFSELQYLVERTGRAGDQGVDLIVCKDGHRIAVQVKGYVDSVPNTAIQEAFTGMAYYGCHACAVVTNSRFTSGGKNIAGSVGCALIDENSLPMLILGELDLWQETLAAKARHQPDCTARRDRER